ncbi:unnamed protein product [Chrysoparadoxa australica]
MEHVRPVSLLSSHCLFSSDPPLPPTYSAGSLCDYLSGNNPELGGFIKAPPGSLDWEARKWRIMEEVLRVECDVIVLCEVDHYDDFMRPLLEGCGYRSLFVGKPASPCLQYGSAQADGCCLFYKEDKLDLMSSRGFTFAHSESDSLSVESKAAAAEKLVVQNQVGLLAALRCKASRKELIVGATHLKASKTLQGEISRAKEAREFLDKATALRSQLGKPLESGGTGADVPVLLCGDFNATPRACSMYEGLCYREIEKHPLSLQSVYPLDDDSFTTWKIRQGPDGKDKETRHTIDYMLHSSGITPLSYLGMPSSEDLGAARAPSFVYPSDHFSLVATFALE